MALITAASVDSEWSRRCNLAGSPNPNPAPVPGERPLTPKSAWQELRSFSAPPLSPVQPHYTRCIKMLIGGGKRVPKSRVFWAHIR
jgi:hypothetical protein